MNVRQLKFGIIVAAAIAASGCGVFGHKKASTPVLGERIAVLASESDVSVDPATAALPMSLPAPVVNPAWSQSGGNASKAMAHVALGGSLTQAWEVSIGQGTSLAARLAAAPIVADGRVYTIDTLATVRAFDAQTGAPVWRTQFGTEKGNDAALFGGGLAYDNGRIYATNGLGFVVALDATNGGIAGRSDPAVRFAALRRSPTTRSM